MLKSSRLMTQSPYKVLFVCMGNICRSPAAEMIFHQLVTRAGCREHFLIDSAGTIGNHAGNAPDYRMTQTLQGRGVDIFGTSRKITAADLTIFDLILVMDQDNYDDVSAMDSTGAQRGKIHLLTEYCQELRDTRVPDPYYGGQQGFDYVADLVVDACTGLLAHLRKKLSLS